MEINLSHLEKKNIWLTADPHLGHDKEFIWGKRGYKSEQEHRESWFTTINNTVGRESALIILGDFCLNTTEENCRKYMNDINCNNVYLLWGNHNNPIKKIYGTELANQHQVPVNAEMYPFRFRNFVFSGYYAELKTQSNRYVLMHYPIVSWNHASKGVPMIHGHCHYNYLPGTLSSKNGKILDVGWEGFKRPLNLEEIDLYMTQKQIVEVDHH